MKYTIDAIPTRYNGVHFRSQLEANWAAFFDLCGWSWEYEPVRLDKWFPDFILSHGGHRRVLVEVKPFDMLSPPVADVAEQLERMRRACTPRRFMLPFRKIKTAHIPCERMVLLGQAPWRNEMDEWFLGSTHGDTLRFHRCTGRALDFAPSAGVNHWLCDRQARRTAKRMPYIDALWGDAKLHARYEHVGTVSRGGREGDGIPRPMSQAQKQSERGDDLQTMPPQRPVKPKRRLRSRRLGDSLPELKRRNEKGLR